MIIDTVDVFQQIDHAVLDLQASQLQTYDRPLKTLARLLDSPGLQSVNAKLTEGLDLDAFLDSQDGRAGMVGSDRLNWPDDPQKVMGLTLLLIRRFAENPDWMTEFGHVYFYSSSNKIIAAVHNINRQMIIPFTRDYKAFVLKELAARKNETSTSSSDGASAMTSAFPSPMSVLREAIKAVPAVKWALGVGGVLGALALVSSFQLDARFAFVGLIVMFIFMGVLVLFARASALHSRTVALPALVFTWFVLFMFMATTLSLFSSVFFKQPLDLQDWLTGSGSRPVALTIPNADSDWIDGGSSPNEFCEPILASHQRSNPGYDITMQVLPEQHRSEYTPFKHDIYRYQCSFTATPKAS